MAGYFTCIWALNQYDGFASFISLYEGGDPKIPLFISFYKNGLYLYSYDVLPKRAMSKIDKKVTFGPVMRKENIKICIFLTISLRVFSFHLRDSTQKFHSVDLKLLDMIGWYFGVSVKWSSLRFEDVLKISVVVNTWHSWNPYFTWPFLNSDGSSLSQIVNIFGYPTPKI